VVALAPRRRTRAGVRRELLDDLLCGVDVSGGERLAAAHAAGLHAEARCFVAVAVATDPDLAPPALDRAAQVLARALGGTLPALAGARPGEAVALRALARTEPLPAREAFEQARAELAVEGIDVEIGVSTVHDTPHGLPRAYREAHAALRSLAVDGAVARLADLSAFDYLVQTVDATAERLIDPGIRRFVAADVARGGMLTSTLEAYAQADLNVTAAAEKLFVHVNTARYRLGRVADETGADLRRLPDVLELVIAIRLARARLDG
jgi:hypothetical protein